MRDHISAYETAINKGLAEGEAKGHSKGLAERLSKGKMEGVKEERMQTARRMKAKGFTLDVISEMSGLSPGEIALL